MEAWGHAVCSAKKKGVMKLGRQSEVERRSAEKAFCNLPLETSQFFSLKAFHSIL